MWGRKQRRIEELERDARKWEAIAAGLRKDNVERSRFYANQNQRFLRAATEEILAAVRRIEQVRQAS